MLENERARAEKKRQQALAAEEENRLAREVWRCGPPLDVHACSPPYCRQRERLFLQQKQAEAEQVEVLERRQVFLGNQAEEQRRQARRQAERENEEAKRNMRRAEREAERERRKEQLQVRG